MNDALIIFEILAIVNIFPWLGGVKVYEKYLELLLKNNKTTYQVAKETGIPTSTFSNWKAGRYTPKLDKLKLIADYFGVPIEYFLE